jgi:glutathione S-transferase
MDKQLALTPWLSGDDYSIADISLVVYLTRMTSFQMAPLWQNLNHLRAWFDKIKARNAYKTAVDDWGDVTAEKRQKEGQAAFEQIKSLWESVEK